MQCLGKLGKLATQPYSPFPSEEKSPQPRSSLLILSSAFPGDTLGKGKWSYSWFSVQFFLSVFVVVVGKLFCWSSLSGLLSSPRAIFVHEQMSNCWSLWGWRLVSPTPPFWWHPSQLKLNITNQRLCASTKYALSGFLIFFPLTSTFFSPQLLHFSLNLIHFLSLAAMIR